VASAYLAEGLARKFKPNAAAYVRKVLGSVLGCPATPHFLEPGTKQCAVLLESADVKSFGLASLNANDKRRPPSFDH